MLPLQPAGSKNSAPLKSQPFPLHPTDGVHWPLIFASVMFLYAVGDAENLSKATVCRTIRAVCLTLKDVLHIFVTFPGHRRMCYIREDFYKIENTFDTSNRDGLLKM